MAESEDNKLTWQNVTLGTLITVLIAEIVPVFFIFIMTWWQTKILGSPATWNSFFSKGTYQLQDMTRASNLFFGIGVIVTLALGVFLFSLIVDEWIYSHHLKSLKNVLIVAICWAAAYFVVDSIFTALNFYSIQNIYPGLELWVALIIFATPFFIFYSRKLTKNSTI